MIAILGGGISGLSAAFELKKAGKEFILLEANKQVGGKIHSSQEQGFTLEHGPNTVLINNPEIKKLIEELGLWDELIFPEEKASSNRFVLKNGTIEPFPSGLKKMLKSNLFSFSTLLSVLKEPFNKSRSTAEDESLGAFVERRLGKQILDDFITPFVTGIYAGDPYKMSAKYTMNLLKEAEEKHGSIVKGAFKIMKAKKLENEKYGLPKQKIFTFKNGLQQLITALQHKVEKEIQWGATCSKIEYSNKEYTIHYEQSGAQKAIIASHVISALPAFALAELAHNFAYGLSTHLDQISYVPAMAVHFGFDSKNMTFPEKAFGILSRNAEQVPFLGVLFNSHFFPHTAPQGKDLITVICGGARYPEIVDKSDDEVVEEISSCLKSLLGLTGEFELTNIVRWKRGIPQYNVGYPKIEREIDLYLGAHHNFKITANFYKGISVSDCVKNGSLAAQFFI
ncbi:MAG: oxygen-dependent protoporphyrinogen oxidase [Vicingaceae bacterium]|jgi:oxygen-dependent protoporphyrinogen oxidase